MANYLKMTAREQWAFTWRNFRLAVSERREGDRTEFMRTTRTVGGRAIQLNAFGITPMGACPEAPTDGSLYRLAVNCIVIHNVRRAEGFQRKSDRRNGVICTKELRP